jgi:hypothetical protein
VSRASSLERFEDGYGKAPVGYDSGYTSEPLTADRSRGGRKPPKRPTVHSYIILLDTNNTRKWFSEGIGKRFRISIDYQSEMPYQIFGCTKWFYEADVEITEAPPGEDAPIQVGDKVTVTSDLDELKRSFIDIPYPWHQGMVKALGRTFEVLKVEQGEQIIGLAEAEENSGRPIWYYSRGALNLASHASVPMAQGLGTNSCSYTSTAGLNQGCSYASSPGLNMTQHLKSLSCSYNSNPGPSNAEVLIPCASRRPIVGDRVKMLSGEFGQIPPFLDANGREIVWGLLPGEYATVVAVDADGDFQLRNPAGLDSKFVFRNGFGYVQAVGDPLSLTAANRGDITSPLTWKTHVPTYDIIDLLSRSSKLSVPWGTREMDRWHGGLRRPLSTTCSSLSAGVSLKSTPTHSPPLPHNRLTLSEQLMEHRRWSLL